MIGETTWKTVAADASSAMPPAMLETK